MRIQRPWIACFISFVLPGAGLAYLGNWRMAAINFLLVIGILTTAIVAFPDRETLSEYFHYLMLVLSAASGGFAHAYAGRSTSAG